MDHISFSRERLRFLINRHAPDPSLRKLSLSMGCRENYLSNLLNSDAADHAKGGPRLLPMLRLCEALGIGMDELVGRYDAPNPCERDDNLEAETAQRVKNAHQNSRLSPDQAPTIQGMMFRLYKSDCDLSAVEEFMDFFDLYLPPTSPDDDIEAVHVGTMSMAGITMGEANTAKLSRALNDTSPDLKAKLIQDYLNCLEKGPISTIESLDQKMSSMPVKVKMDYMRLLAPVTDTKGKQYILTYAVPLF